MTPAARIQAAIELLDEIIHAARQNGAAADTLIARYFSTRRYAGSKDRRAVRELVYAAIRRAGEVPENGRAAIIGLGESDPDLLPHFTGEGHAPLPIGDGEKGAPYGIAPSWILDKLKASGIGEEEWPALLSRASLDLRVNRLKATRDEVQEQLPEAEILKDVGDGLRLPVGSSIEQSPVYRDGLAEVQDAGSQVAAILAAAEPGMAVVDLCAGGGGKTLALAAMMANQGQLIASDTDRGRLSRLSPRAERAGASIIETRLLNPGKELELLSDLKEQADRVLIDAPCSGSGTWRRNPEARWRLTPERIARFADMQSRLLEIGAAFVKPGGRLTYITCSLFDEEGAEQIQRFRASHPDWQPVSPETSYGRHHGDGIRLSPFRDSTDGFFIATLARPC